MSTMEVICQMPEFNSVQSIHARFIVTCINNSIHKLISSVDIHSDALLMQNYFTL